MRTFQFSDAKSHKFWNVDVRGSDLVVTFGKIGTAGQTQTKTFATADQARAEADKLVREKTKKGYVEMTPKATASDADRFEAALRANPHDLAGHCAFADFLAERGDPRGEFMQVQIALEEESRPKAERKKLVTREAALLERHEAEWVGDWPERIRKMRPDSGQLDPSGGKVYEFERGLLTTVSVGDLTLVAARRLCAATTTRFVRNLFVAGLEHELVGEEDDEDEARAALGPDIPGDSPRYPAQYALLRWPQLRFIRRFTWGFPADESVTDFPHRCWMPGDHVFDFVKQMPDIEELRVFAHVRDASKLVALPMPNLRVFELYHGWSFPLERLAANKSLGNLTHLYCHPHGLESDDEPYIRLPELRAICRSRHLKSLTHLALRLTDVGDKGAREIADSGILKRLKVLDLQHGCVSDEGADILAGCPDLGHLELLHLGHNALSPKGVATLKKSGVRVVTDHMHTETAYNPDDFNEFLAHGDPE